MRATHHPHRLITVHDGHCTVHDAHCTAHTAGDPLRTMRTMGEYSRHTIGVQQIEHSKDIVHGKLTMHNCQTHRARHEHDEIAADMMRYSKLCTASTLCKVHNCHTVHSQHSKLTVHKYHTHCAGQAHVKVGAQQAQGAWEAYCLRLSHTTLTTGTRLKSSRLCTSSTQCTAVKSARPARTECTTASLSTTALQCTAGRTSTRLYSSSIRAQ